MEVKLEDLKKGKIKLIITVPAEDMVAYFNKSYTKLAPTVKIDGFRAGKAPRKIVESTIGIARILSEALDEAVQVNYGKALQEKKLIPVTSPNVIINKYPTYGNDAEKVKDDLEFEAELEVLPEVKIGDYSKIKIKKGETEKSKPEDLEKVLTQLQKQKATFAETKKAIEKGDWAEISFEGSLKGVRIDKMCSKNYPLIVGEGNLIPGFEEEIVGMKKGEKKEFKIKFPKDYHDKEMASKDAEFKVEILNLKEVTLPEFNDKFADDFGHKNMEELKKAITENLDKEYEQKHHQGLEAKVMEAILPFFKSDIPEGLIIRETERMLEDYRTQISKMGLNFDQYLASTKKSLEDLRKDMMPQAEKNVKIGLMLGKVIEENKWDSNDPKAGKKAIDSLVEKLVSDK